jgi:hypothetical protein
MGAAGKSDALIPTLSLIEPWHRREPQLRRAASNDVPQGHRNGLDWTKRFSTIAGALDIPGQSIIDGEVVVVHEGRTNFSELQAELAACRQDLRRLP